MNFLGIYIEVICRHDILQTFLANSLGVSQKGRRGNPSLTETQSDQQQSRQRRLSNESMKISTAECAQTSSMDATFLDRLNIDTPTPENVGNTSGQENIFGNFI